MTPDSGIAGPADQAGWLSLRELAAGLARTPLLDQAGALDEPLLIVDLHDRGDPALLTAAREQARASERMLAGVRAGAIPPGQPWQDLVAALDLTLVPHAAVTPLPCIPVPDPVAAARQLRRAAAACPQACLALAQVLRSGPQLEVPAALALESFAYSTLLGGSEFGRWLNRRPVRAVPEPGPDPAVVAERQGDWLLVTLNRPARRNAYSRELRDALTGVLLVPVLDETIARVTITGAGPSFSSGGDLDEFGTAPDAATAHFIRTSGGAAGLLHRIAARTEAAVHGACVGAGVELAAFAGRVSAAPGTTFRLPELAMGLIPGAGGTVSLPRRIGRWRTAYLALRGEALDADTAVRWGLVDRILPAHGS
jgi:enoyl-CoA hydratase/carnithine racemase